MIVTCLLCSLSFGSYFCFDNPAALHEEFLKDMDMSESTYMGLYAWYSWPNVVLSFVGGYLIDRVFGVRLGASIFSLFCICGQARILFAIFTFKEAFVEIFCKKGCALILTQFSPKFLNTFLKQRSPAILHLPPKINNCNDNF